MKHIVLPRRYLRIMAICCLAGCLAGCANRAGDSRKMKAMAEKLRQQVQAYAEQGKVIGAQRLAEASCLFAREMDCVSGKPADTGTDSSTWKNRSAVMELSEWRQQVNSIVLNPKEYPGGFSAKDYDTVLRWVLSDIEMEQLEAIRKEHGYWDELQKVF